MRATGIEYKNTDEEGRGNVSNYHATVRLGFKEHHKGGKNTDIAQLKKLQMKNFSLCSDGDFKSKFTIGIEVEKTSFSRDAIKEYPLFAGFETDSSCGYEAVTHILPLLPAGKWRNKVFSMMFDAEKIIDDRYSPSNKTCGGHITVAVDGMSGSQLRTTLKPFVGIIYALFRNRMTNKYCGADLGLEINPVPTRYKGILEKDNCIEFRLVSRFQSVKQMMRRYELMYTIVDFAVNNPNGSHNTLLKRCLPIVKSMYEGDMDKVCKVMSLAKSFRKFLVTGIVNRAIVNYVKPYERTTQYGDLRFHSMPIDADLRRNGYSEY
jgi:hypothetical protein